MLSLPKNITTKIKGLGVWGVGELLTQSMNFFHRNMIFMKINKEGVFLPQKKEQILNENLVFLQFIFIFWNFKVNSYKFMINLW